MKISRNELFLTFFIAYPHIYIYIYIRVFFHRPFAVKCENFETELPKLILESYYIRIQAFFLLALRCKAFIIFQSSLAVAVARTEFL